MTDTDAVVAQKINNAKSKQWQHLRLPRDAGDVSLAKESAIFVHPAALPVPRAITPVPATRS
jgi:hypothetical protein